ncbi:hypothetical protein BH11PLA2_BH11PLA2_12820 [soil metagenome]
MISETTFRKTLIDQLTAVANSREIDKHLLQMQYVEDKMGILSEFLDYYTDELLKYQQFANEFELNEINELRKFLDLLRVDARERIVWPEVQTRAKDILVRLANRQT